MWLASLVSQRGDRPCGRVAAAARRELSTHRSGEVRPRGRWCDRRCLVVGATRGDSDYDGRGKFVLAARRRADERRLRQEAVEAILGVHGRVDCLPNGVSDWRLS
jgi:hypothetical protein